MASQYKLDCLCQGSYLSIFEESLKLTQLENTLL